MTYSEKYKKHEEPLDIPVKIVVEIDEVVASDSYTDSDVEHILSSVSSLIKEWLDTSLYNFLDNPEVTSVSVKQI